MTSHYTHGNDGLIADLYRQGLTTYEIGARLGTSPGPVTCALKRQGVELRRGGRRTNWTGSTEQKAEVVAAYRSGESIRSIADRLHMNAQRLIDTLNEAGIVRR